MYVFFLNLWSTAQDETLLLQGLVAAKGLDSLYQPQILSLGPI